MQNFLSTAFFQEVGRMIKRGVLLTIMILLAVNILFLAGGCAGKCPRRTAGADVIKVGALFNLTGAQSSLDVPGLNGFQLAAREINKSGGLLGRKIEVVAMDGKTDQKTCGESASRLIEVDKVVAVCGLADSNYALAAGSVTQNAGVLFLTSGATLPTLPDLVGDYFFLVPFGDDSQAYAAADFSIEEIKAASAWMLTDEAMDFTKTLSGFYRERFEIKGGKVILEDVFQTPDVDFSAQIERLSKLNPPPQVLFISSGPSTAGPIVRQIREHGIKIPIISGDGFDTPLLVEMGGPGANMEVYFTAHASMSNQSEKVQNFVKAYKAAYGSEPENSFAALGYDAMYLLADAIERAGDADSDRIRDALLQTRGFEAVTGTISYKNNRRVPEKSVSILTIRDGRFAFIREMHPE